MTIAKSGQMLVRLGFSASAANEIYQQQGIDFIDKWENFDKDDVVSLICSVRKPSGGRNVDMVGLKSEINIQISVFFVHHKICTIRKVDYGDINVPTIHYLNKKRKIEAIKDPKNDDPTINFKDVSKTYESLIRYLHGMRGVSAVTVSYVARARNELHPKPSVDDPVTAYVTHDEEMVKRAWIIATGNPLGMEEDGPLDESFFADREKVRDIISPLIIKT